MHFHLIIVVKIHFFQSCYLGRIMHTMSVMARKDDREGVLYYFDFEQENSVSMGKKHTAVLYFD